MRFDDSLDTVLTASLGGPGAIEMMWRQAVDLIGRRRGGRAAAAIERLRAIRDDVPMTVRAASARGLERANPPADLVALFVVDQPEVAVPVARSARLSATEWEKLLPSMHPVVRGVLRHRRDLPDRVVSALAAFGPTDLTLTADAGAVARASAPVAEDVPPVDVWPTADAFPLESAPTTADPAEEPGAKVPETTEWAVAEVQSEVVWPPVEGTADAPPPSEAPTAIQAEQPETPRPPVDAVIETQPPEPLPFVAIGEAARALPVVAEALRQEPVPAAPAPSDRDFEIAELVARIEAHQATDRDRPLTIAPLPAPDAPPTRFRFETDARGVIRWCEGVGRGPVVGLSLAAGRDGAPATVDASAAGALARRARFADAHLSVPGRSPTAGSWRISGTPVFDHASGRFTGYRGTARRPRPDEAPRSTDAGTDAIRQLVHELRTPANAISGFAEMIVHELLGPVPPAYRDQAQAIGAQAASLIGAIDDLDTAARIEARGLDLYAEPVRLEPLLAEVARDLGPLAQERRTALTIQVAAAAMVDGDRRALERLFGRLLAALIASAGADEVLTMTVAADGRRVRCEITRPAALAVSDGALFGEGGMAAAGDGGTVGMPLLGADFALRLARRLAGELGGSLTIGTERLTLMLPAAVSAEMEQATV